MRHLLLDVFYFLCFLLYFPFFHRFFLGYSFIFFYSILLWI